MSEPESSLCDIQYTGESAAIHFLSRKIACVSEIGYEFINNVMSANITLSAYKELKYKAYSMYNSYSKPFMSCASFIYFLKMWAARFNLEFRNEIDHVCGHYPHVCDGTHLGIQLKNLNITTINQSQ